MIQPGKSVLTLLFPLATLRVFPPARNDPDSDGPDSENPPAHPTARPPARITVEA